MVLRLRWMQELAMSPIYFDSFDRNSDFVWKTLIGGTQSTTVKGQGIKDCTNLFNTLSSGVNLMEDIMLEV